jgi:hypothetical protein
LEKTHLVNNPVENHFGHYKNNISVILISPSQFIISTYKQIDAKFIRFYQNQNIKIKNKPNILDESEEWDDGKTKKKIKGVYYQEKSFHDLNIDEECWDVEMLENNNQNLSNDIEMEENRTQTNVIVSSNAYEKHFKIYDNNKNIELAQTNIVRNGGRFIQDRTKIIFENTCSVDYFLLIIFMLSKTNIAFQSILNNKKKDSLCSV